MGCEMIVRPFSTVSSVGPQADIHILVLSPEGQRLGLAYFSVSESINYMLNPLIFGGKFAFLFRVDKWKYDLTVETVTLFLGLQNHCRW